MLFAQSGVDSLQHSGGKIHHCCCVIMQSSALKQNAVTLSSAGLPCPHPNPSSWWWPKCQRCSVSGGESYRGASTHSDTFLSIMNIDVIQISHKWGGFVFCSLPQAGLAITYRCTVWHSFLQDCSFLASFPLLFFYSICSHDGHQSQSWHFSPQLFLQPFLQSQFLLFLSGIFIITYFLLKWSEQWKSIWWINPW